MQLSIREASRYMIGTAIIREMATSNSPNEIFTFSNISAIALRNGEDGKNLRASIETLAEQESGWFRSMPLHVQKTDRVMQTRAREMEAINSIQLAALMTLELSSPAQAGRPDAKAALQERLQGAVKAIDEVPASTTEKRGMLQTLETQCVAASGNDAFIRNELKTAQEAYLNALMSQRLSAYETPSHKRSDDLDMSP